MNIVHVDILSHVEQLWNGIPSQWAILPLKYLCSRSALYGANVTSDVYSPNGVRFLRTSDIRDDGSLDSDGVFLPNELVTEYILQPGDLIISRSGTVGRAFIYSAEYGPCAYAGYLVRFVLNSKQSPRYYFYITKSPQFQLWLGTSAIEATIGNVNGEKYANLLLPNPPLSEQRTIANYLDRATAQIDAMIAAKQRLLELLAEKRRALITHAVTHGLDATVPMRDSGVEWLGEIPRHWRISVIRRFVKNIEQGWSPQADEREPAEGEWGVLKLNAVKNGQFDETKAKALASNLEIPTSLEIHSGDFLVTRANTPELVGDVCYVKKAKPKLILSDLIYRLQLNNSIIDGQYLSLLLQTPFGRKQIEIDARGSSSSMVKVSQGHILDWLMLVPPLHEQISIVRNIEEKVSKIDSLCSIAEDTIKLLHERRTALIAAAVTGQLNLE